VDEGVELVGRPGTSNTKLFVVLSTSRPCMMLALRRILHHLLALARNLQQRQFALQMVKEEHPHLAVLDVMPKMNGFDVCNAIERELGLTDVYVVC
jgi:CheY-like chemotaxis protein